MYDKTFFRACSIGGVVPALAKIARTGHPRFRFRKRDQDQEGSATRPDSAGWVDNGWRLVQQETEAWNEHNEPHTGARELMFRD